MSTEIRALAREIDSIRTEVRGLSTGPQLAFSAIENGSVKEFDATGALVSQVGQQFDGSHMAAPLSGPVPPTPVAPTATAKPGAATFAWSGLFVDDAIVTMDWSRAELHVSSDPNFDATLADNLRGTFETPRGGELSVLLTPGSTYYARLVSRSLAGKVSVASEAVSVTPGDIVDPAEVAQINADVAAAQDAATAAQMTADAANTAASDAATHADQIDATVAGIPDEIAAAKAQAIAAAATDAQNKASAAQAAAVAAATADAQAKADAAKQAAIDAAALTAQQKADLAQAAAINAASTTAQQKADAAQAAAIAAAATTAQQKADAAKQAAIDAAAITAQAKADTAKADALAGAAVTAQQKADAAAAAAQAAATTAAAADAKTKADNAQAAAIAAAALDAKTKADAAQAAAIDSAATTAQAKADAAKQTAIDAAALTAQAKADAAQSAATTAAAADAKAKADAAQVAAQAAAQTYSDTVASGAKTDAIAAAAADAKTKADAAQAAATTAAAADAKAKADAAQAAAIASAATTAQAKADLAQAAAISAAAADAKTKADNAQANAITSAALTAQQKADLAQANALASSKAWSTSRGTDLMTNGTGYLGDNTNFSALNFDPLDAPIGATGSFDNKNLLIQGVAYNDENIAIDPKKSYKASISIKQKDANTTARSYLGISFRDVDGNPFGWQNCQRVPGTDTTLAQPLKTGDTKVYLTSVAGWKGQDSGQYVYSQYLVFYDYVNSKGYKWPPYTFSLNVWANPTVANGTIASVNTADNSLTLVTAYTGPNKPAGLAISEGVGGDIAGRYFASNVLATSAWTAYSAVYSGVQTTHTPGPNQFPYGTAMVRLFGTYNYSRTDTTTPSRIGFAAWSLSDAAAAQATADATAGLTAGWTKTGTTQIDGGAIYADSVTAAQIAAGAITASEIATDAVIAGKIIAGAVTAGKLAASSVIAGNIATDAVTAGTIAADSITSVKILAGAVIAGKLAADSVLATNIIAGAVTAGKLAASSVIAGNIATDAVTATTVAAGAIIAGKLATDSVLAANIKAGEVVAGKLAANAVTAGTIAADAVTAATIAAGSVTSGKILAGNVTATELATDAVTAIKIQANAVIAGKIATDAVTAITIKAGEVTAGKLGASSVIAGNIATDAVTAGTVAAGAIVAGKIATDAVLAANVKAGEITAGKLAAGAVIAGNLAANAVTAGTIAAGAITADKLDAAAIDGKTITGAILRTGSAGGRISMHPGVSSIGKGQSVMEFWSGAPQEALPAEITGVTDGPNPGDNASLILIGPGLTGYYASATDRASVQIFARDSNTANGVALTGEFVQVSSPYATFTGDISLPGKAMLGVQYVPNSYKTLSANTASVSTPTKVAALSGISFTNVSNHYYKFVFRGMVAGAAGTVPIVYLYQDGVSIAQVQTWVGSAAGFSVALDRMLGSANSANHVYDIYVNNGFIAAGGSYPAAVWIEDLGSTGA